MPNPFRRSLLAALPVLGALSAATAARAASSDAAGKVVYHVNDTKAQATAALRNMRNHLDVAPDTRIVCVAHADGIDMLMEGAHDAQNPDMDYPSLIGALAARGVRFEVCVITMERRGLDEDAFVMDAEFTPSGVARITQLQQQEGYAYLKP